MTYNDNKDSTTDNNQSNNKKKALTLTMGEAVKEVIEAVAAK